jgi:hypothetical protein
MAIAILLVRAQVSLPQLVFSPPSQPDRSSNSREDQSNTGRLPLPIDLTRTAFEITIANMSKSPITCHGIFDQINIYAHNNTAQVLDSSSGKPAAGVAVSVHELQVNTESAPTSFHQLASG